jgi:hypothetical protein
MLLLHKIREETSPEKENLQKKPMSFKSNVRIQ